LLEWSMLCRFCFGKRLLEQAESVIRGAGRISSVVLIDLK
jgi:hypothetical protein